MIYNIENNIVNRYKKIFNESEQDIDAFLVMNTEIADVNFRYLTGFTSGVFEDSYLIVEKEHATLITNPLEYETAKKMKPSIMDIINVRTGDELKNILKRMLESKKVGINEKFISISSYKELKKINAKFIDASEILSNARAIKDEYEIENIRKANRITKKALGEIEEYFKVGMTEKQLAAHLEFLFREYGGEDLAFETIVAFGQNSALPHHFSSDSKLKENSFILIDCGTKYRNYCADVTRTFIFKPDKNSTKYKKMNKIYDTVKNAQMLGINSIHEGVYSNEPYEKVLNYINTVNNGAFKDTFIHSLGHPVGLNVHDEGPIMGRSKELLKENMVLSVEPGIYIIGFGGVRIEDDVVIKKHGAEVLK
ncbi:MAG: M24 family metallopeptidase [Candidatus Micrarchaeia archaeon]